jgi:hypothetical protein
MKKKIIDGEVFTYHHIRVQGPYTETIDLWFEQFFGKRDKARNWMIARD